MRRLFVLGWLAVFFAGLSLAGATAAEGASPVGGANCSISAATETDGHRRLALVVGVGEYLANPDRMRLRGPARDARRFMDLLTGPNGFGFPRENVCILTDMEATGANVREAFEKVLVARAQPGDVAVFYFAGHGSQSPDSSGDESDGLDETLLFHDARAVDGGEVVDDEVAEWLDRLRARAGHVVVILDSCNSGSATRGDEYLARWQEPASGSLDAARVGSRGDGSQEGVHAAAATNVVVLTAASDGTSALERNGVGLFTDSLIEVLTAPEALTYAQVGRRLPPRLASRGTPQIAYVQGAIDERVFLNTGRRAPQAWEVIAIGRPSPDAVLVRLGGPALPAASPGAEFRIFDGSLSATELRDPTRAKAIAVVERADGISADAVIRRPTARGALPAVNAGDIAILVRPGDSYHRLPLRLRPASEMHGLPPALADLIRTRIVADPDVEPYVALTQTGGDFEAGLDALGRLALFGPSREVRNVFAQARDEDRAAELAIALSRHARQRGLLSLRGEGAADFVDQETLEVQLKPAARQTPCARGPWEQAPPNREQVVPLCHRWNVEVTNRGRVPLLVGGVVLSSDGSMLGFPRRDRRELLEPGRTVVFDGPGETFQGQPPFDIQDHVLVFGTQDGNYVRWDLLTMENSARRREEAAAPPSGLQRAISRFLTPGLRGQGLADYADEGAWTVTSVPLRVEANPRFMAAPTHGTAAAGAGIQAREYTIPNFDIRPYLPDDTGSALFAVLQRAHGLVNADFGYRQHDWSAPDDDTNLRRGVDCSRAIWFAFTRSGLQFNRTNAYLPTAEMVGPQSRMNEAFQPCSGDDLRTGDVLVYRDLNRGDGHTVMVIDPRRRIAWGSHGWDGNAREPPFTPATGVEYQLIKYKPDWTRWDRPTMLVAACWRHRRFAEEATALRSVSTGAALGSPCDTRTCRR